jgi:uncharacterized protein YbcV (DUF1398 family)
MFTADSLKHAHSKVKSGADFPAYIRELKTMGVVFYETFVQDGHADFYGDQAVKVTLSAKYEPLKISNSSDTKQFQADLRDHQQGKTDYPTFCKDAARAGVEKWKVSLDNMTCTYVDKEGNKMITENIPG